MINRFNRELSKALLKRLPQSTEYEWSRRIEGALVRSEEAAAHRHVAIIIDCEIAEEDAASILGELIQFARHNNYFRQSKYRVLLWKENEFSRATPVDIPASSIARHLEKIDAYGTASGSWENFREIYSPHRKAGQVILITTADKVARLEESLAIRAKNLLILYPNDDTADNKMTISGIPCIPYKKDNGTNECY